MVIVTLGFDSLRCCMTHHILLPRHRYIILFELIYFSLIKCFTDYVPTFMLKLLIENDLEIIR